MAKIKVMKKYVISDEVTLSRNEKYLEKREQSNFDEFAQQCETVEITGSHAWRFLKVIGTDEFQNLLDMIQPDIDSLNRFEVLVVESETDGLKYRVSFVMEYPETKRNLATLRVSFNPL